MALSLLDANRHALTVDVGYLEMRYLGDAQAGGVSGYQDDFVLPALDGPKELRDFFLT